MTNCRTVALRQNYVDGTESYSATNSKNCIFIAQKKLRIFKIYLSNSEQNLPINIISQCWEDI